MSRLTSKIAVFLMLAFIGTAASGCVTPITVDCTGAPTLTCEP
jgi:hypothetical protein